MKLLGMNTLHPEPVRFPVSSSVANTLEACDIYDIKPPSLNSELFDELLKQTNMAPDLRDSLVRGWREGYDLGSDLPNEDHFVKESVLGCEEVKALAKELYREKKLKRLHGPVPEPYKDNRWFNDSWVSPYFVIPKKTPKGMPQKWRVIHHLSYHNTGSRELSFNGHIDLKEYPTEFPTYLSGAHLVF